MSTLTISPELIEHAKKEVDIKKYFVESDTCRANHLLYKDFKEGSRWVNLPKVIFYILMNEHYNIPYAKDEQGLFGYKLKFKKPDDE